MSYAKSLKKSPFKSISISLGKMPDGSIWQTALFLQGGDVPPVPSASFTCHSDATAAECKGFLPLVKEALKRAQSLDELTDMLKPFADDRRGPVEPDIWAGGQWSEEDKARMQQTSTKAQLLNLMKNDDHQQAVEDVLNSGLLPDQQLHQWLNQLVERAIRRTLGLSGCPEWENWATKWLSGKDRSEAPAWTAARAARAAGAAGAALAARAAALAALAAGAALAAWAAERKAQYDDLFNLINDL